MIFRKASCSLVMGIQERLSLVHDVVPLWVTQLIRSFLFCSCLMSQPFVNLGLLLSGRKRVEKIEFDFYGPSWCEFPILPNRLKLYPIRELF